MGDELQDFIHSLTNERPANVGAKEQELVRLRDKIRKTQAKYRKHKQRMKEMAAAIRATSNELAYLKSEAVRIRAEIQSFENNIADWPASTKRSLSIQSLVYERTDAAVSTE